MSDILISSLSPHYSVVLDKAQELAASRMEVLQDLADYIRAMNADHLAAKLVFICTHNSRRSHLSQIWAQVAAAYFEVPDVRTFSGGTEATAFDHRAVAALERVGFHIERSEGSNPRYLVHFSDQHEPMIAWSKHFGDDANPSQDFAAIMTCSHAEEACPFVPGASRRFSINYDDPKLSDGTPHERETYDERSLEIAAEMAYVMKMAAGTSSLA